MADALVRDNNGQNLSHVYFEDAQIPQGTITPVRIATARVI
jgi:hypothetical protein